jgi:DNA-binding transcriptional ArsR family regulator
MQAQTFRPLTPSQLEDISTLFKVLGEPMRLRILQAVCHQPRSVNQIVSVTGGMQANISKHLALLTMVGILWRRKDGQQVFYGVRNRLAVRLCEVVRTQLDGRATVGVGTTDGSGKDCESRRVPSRRADRGS